jgi:predicted HicB family RNase H-like nuclease
LLYRTYMAEEESSFINVRIPRDLRGRIDTAREMLGQSLTTWVERALQSVLEQQESEQDGAA